MSDYNVTPINKADLEVKKVIAEFNRVYTTLTTCGKNYVLRMNTNAFGHAELEFFTYPNFIEFHRDSPKLKVTIQNDDGKRTSKLINPAKYWLDSPDSVSSKYGITFYPVLERFYKGKLNSYMGLGCEPMNYHNDDLGIKLYLNHIKKIICAGNNEHYEYVLNWMAHLIQKPWEKPEVAIVLKAGQGTGKGSFVNPIGKIIGAHYLYANTADQVVGKFNSQLENKILVFADEFFAGHKSATDQLKTKITEPIGSIERKGQDRIAVPCYSRIVMASNHENIIRIEKDERRYLFLAVDESEKQNSAYFDPLKDEVNKEDFPSKLLQYLLDRDITSFSPRAVPKTKALTEQKIDNLEPLDRWIYNVLLDGCFTKDSAFLVRSPSEYYHAHASNWIEKNKLNIFGDIPRKVGKLLTALGAKTSQIRDQKTGKRPRWTELPDLDTMRSNFSKHIASDLDWGEPED